MDRNSLAQRAYINLAFRDDRGTHSTTAERCWLDADVQAVTNKRLSKENCVQSFKLSQADYELLIKSTSQAVGIKRKVENLFEAVNRGDLKGLQELLETSCANTELVYLLNAETKENLLHYALRTGQKEIATYLINVGPVGFLCQSFSRDIKNLETHKNALHLITEDNDVAMAELLLSKLNKTAKKEIVLSEIWIFLENKRPRKFSCFHLAARKGCLELVTLFQKTGIDINQKNSRGETALHYAVRYNHADVMKFLLDCKAQPNIQNENGSTPLYWAVRYEHNNLIQPLLENGSETEVKRKSGLVSPICLASALGNTTALELLIKYGASVNSKLQGGERPLHLAACEGYIDVARVLLENGANIDERDKMNNTAICLATQTGKAEMVKFLIMNNADFISTNCDGNNVWDLSMKNKENNTLAALVQCVQTSMFSIYGSNATLTPYVQFPRDVSPLLKAAKIGNCDKFTLLLTLNLDPNTIDDDKNSFQHIAAKFNNADIIEKFHCMFSGEKCNKYGQTPLHIACYYGHNESIIALLKQKVTLNEMDEDEKTPLHLAAKNPNIKAETLRQLISSIRETNFEILELKDKDGNTPLHLAAQFLPPDRLWQYREMNLRVCNNNGDTPMHSAAQSGKPDVLEKMLEIYQWKNRDADLNAKNKERKTLLHLAVENGFVDQVKRLISFGAAQFEKDFRGMTALHLLVLASEKHPESIENYLEIIDILLNAEPLLMSETELLLNTMNQDGQSVLVMSSKSGHVSVLEKFLQKLENMTLSADENNEYDITHLIPSTNYNTANCFLCENKIDQQSLIERVLAIDRNEVIEPVLNAMPFLMVESMYHKACMKVYGAWFFLHILYMGLYTHFSLQIIGKDRHMKPLPSYTDSNYLILFLVVPLEPLFILLVNLDLLTRKAKELFRENFFLKCQLTCIKNSINNLAVPVFSLVFVVTVVVWLGMFFCRNQFHDYALSFSLCYGWLYTILFTRGLKDIHHFWKMMLHIIFKDVGRFLVLYVLTLIAFSSVFHVMLQVTDEMATKHNSYQYTVFTVYNLMLGMVEIDSIINEELTIAMREKNRSIIGICVAYIIYMLIASIILVNLLIAMMNDTYSVAKKQKKLFWRIQSIRLGIDIEKRAPKFIFQKLHNLNLRRRSGRWMIEISEADLSLFTKNKRIADNDKLEKRLGNLEKNLERVYSVWQGQHKS